VPHKGCEKLCALVRDVVCRKAVHPTVLRHDQQRTRRLEQALPNHHTHFSVRKVLFFFTACANAFTPASFTSQEPRLEQET